MAKAVRLSDIAKKMNVSTVTVSKALSGQKGVSEEVRAQIQKMADDMGYIPLSTRKLHDNHRSYNIGVLISERFLGKYSSFYAQMYQKVASEAIVNESFSMLEEISCEMEKSLILPKIVKEKKVDGYIVIGRLEETYLEALRTGSRIPSMYLDFTDNRRSSDCVISDSFNGGYCLTNYLFEKGHRSIAYVGTILATGSITDRYLGYTKAILEHQQQVRRDWVIDDRDLATGEMDPAAYFKLPKEMPTAFVCNSDLAASMLIHKLEDQGIRVPQDVSVTGYDNFLFPGLCDVEITTYEVDMREMAKKALRNVIHKINGENYRKGVLIVEGHLVEKNSVQSI
ncbi:MAG: LacI family DNA-binding transcriptional regulator [Butyrivibrio sp.]|jgi:LacI family transcriptional regulator/LacI family purine nucleotide synthesis repressor|nr:LacI family DNA-binding transcriptional regulator [Butyrivibrio sp.]